MLAKLLYSSIVIVLLTGCAREGSGEDSAPQTVGAEWTVLFDGSTLDGWRSYGDSEPGAEWIIEDDAIVLNVDDETETMTGGDLITDGQYENFELELEWRISEGGNSGIFYGVREIEGHEVAYLTGIEMQVLDDDEHPDGQNPETSAGSSYALYPPTQNVVRPVGEYNQVRIVVNNLEVEHWLNGQKVAEYTIDSPDWQERIAASKFADWEHFGKYRKGHIGLQDHTDPVWYRNIRIREL